MVTVDETLLLDDHTGVIWISCELYWSADDSTSDRSHCNPDIDGYPDGLTDGLTDCGDVGLIGTELVDLP